MSLSPQGHDGVVTLCRYPFVFDAQAKTTLLQTDAVIQMQVIYSKLLIEGFSICCLFSMTNYLYNCYNADKSLATTVGLQQYPQGYNIVISMRLRQNMDDLKL